MICTSGDRHVDSIVDLPTTLDIVSLFNFHLKNVFYCLCGYSYFTFPPLFPFTQPPLPQVIPPLLAMSMGQAYMFFIYSIPYAILYNHDYPVTTNLHVILSPFLPNFWTPLSNWQPSKHLCIYDFFLFCLFVYIFLRFNYS